MKRLACIDLGTNTFHLLIVDIDDKGMTEVYRSRIYVNLAEKGIAYIPEIVQKRVYDTLAKYKQSLEKYNVEFVKAIGTAGLRIANNGQMIIDYIAKHYSIDIEVVSGDREAELIYKGVRLSHSFDEGDYIIMDIGGGSIEFILVENKKMVWAKSFSIGLSLLYNKFSKEDPYTKDTIKSIQKYIKEELKLLKNIVKDKNIEYLVGTSGSFDVIEALMKSKTKKDKCTVIHRNEEYINLYSKIIGRSEEERKQIKDIPPSRVKLIPLAFVLIEKIMNILSTEKILISPYNMKEGVLSEM